MYGELFAISAAVLWALTNILVRKGLLGGTAFSAAYISTIVNFLVLWPLALLFTDPEQIGLAGIAFLAIAGLLAATLGRIIRFLALERLGVAGSSPLVASAPLFAAAYAIARGEEFTAMIGGATVLIVLGVILLSEGEWKISRLGVILSLGAAMFYGFSENFRRMGLLEIESPSFGAAIGVSIALFSFSVYGKATKTHNNATGRSRLWFLAAGLSSSLALLFNYAALNITDVVVVVPLINMTTLFALFFTRVFLEQYEKVTMRTIISSLMVVAGAVLIVTRF